MILIPIHQSASFRLVEDCIEIEKIREEARLKRIKEDDERNDQDEEDFSEKQDEEEENVTNGIKDSGQQSTGDATE